MASVIESEEGDHSECVVRRRASSSATMEEDVAEHLESILRRRASSNATIEAIGSRRSTLSLKWEDFFGKMVS